MSQRDTLPKERVDLVFRDLTDPGRHTIAAGVAKIAPTSSLFAIASIATSVAALAKKDAALATSNAAVTNDKKQLALDTDAETIARTDYDAELSTLITLTESNSKTPADVSSMSFKPLVRAPVQKGQPPAPAGIDQINPKKGHGKTKVSVQAPKGAKWHYLVQWAPGPTPPTEAQYQMIVGNGKTRALSGASGTQLWVRAARVSWGLQSDFCTAVLITIP